jgi:hypothetical protein
MGECEEEVYIRPPVGTAHLAGGKGRVLRLKRSLYRLRQAPRAWNKRLETEFSMLEFVQSDADPSLWILQGNYGMVYWNTVTESDYKWKRCLAIHDPALLCETGHRMRTKLETTFGNFVSCV